ncbi:MAG: 2TM domain-containing protein [Solirubrobacterales bacterium]
MADDPIDTTNASEDELRKQAVANVKRKRGFRQTLLAYVIINAALVIVWAATGAGYFWPAWVIGGWGIGLAFQAYDAYGRKRGISEDEISSEMQRLRR